MRRFGHGGSTKPAGRGSAERAFASVLAASANAGNTKFGYMIAGGATVLPAGTSVLAPGAATIQALTSLADGMGEDPAIEGDGTAGDPTTDLAVPGDGTIPAAYTYFGQFIDHDITLVDNVNGNIGLIDRDDFAPMGDVSAVHNVRTPFLELDSVYDGADPDDPVSRPPRDGDKMRVGAVTNVTRPPRFPNGRFKVIPGKSGRNDLPRQGRSNDSEQDRTARIGDPRNDENLIVAQLHVAFLKAHNTLVDLLGSFAAARERLTKIYQSVIIDDYLPRICHGPTLQSIVGTGPGQGPVLFKPSDQLYMPAEFAAAGFRFGHSMVRSRYNFNINFEPANASLFFVFTALSGQLGFEDPENPDRPGTDTFPDNWIIQWERFLPINGSTPQRARPIDTQLTPILFELTNELGVVITSNVAKHLAKRNLLRGYHFNLPTGQAFAAALGKPPITINAASTGVPADKFDPAFSTATPLWLYVLAEARANKGKLGVVGTHIVAETLVTLARRSTPSIFNSDGTRNMVARYKLSDIINLAALQDTEVAGA